MKIEQFNTVKKGDIIFYVANSGTAGIFKYQYLGVFKCHKDTTEKHLFISEYFVSTVCLLKGKEGQSRALKSIFLTENEAVEYQKELIKLNE